MYVDLAGLSRYKSDFGAWARGALLPEDAAFARVRTAKAGAVSFYPVQETPLDVSVDFLFSETPPASGDKGPDNPSTITGVDSIFIRRISENFVTTPYKWFADSQSTSYADHGVTYTLNQDNSITVSGTASGNSYFALLGEDGQNVWFPAGAYRIKATGSSDITLVLNFDSGSQSASTADATRSFSRGFYGRIYYRIANGKTVNNFTVYPQVFLNNAASDVFSVAPGFFNTLSLGGTYYGGTLDVASGVMTVTVYGEQIHSFSYVYNEYSNTVAFRTLLSYPTAQIADSYYGVSDKFEFSGSNTDAEHWRLEGGGDGNRCLFFINKSRLDLSGAVDPSAPTGSEWVDAANAWLADNPVFLVYGVATPTTVQLTPAEILSLAQTDAYTPRLNMVYADAQAVQVGYLKHPSAASSDLRNAVVSLGGGI